jgi:Flp pilus assembly protein TadD
MLDDLPGLQAAEAALILPVDGSDFQRASGIADSDSRRTDLDRDAQPRAILVEALTELRRNRFESASEWAGRLISRNKTDSYFKASAFFVKSMANTQLRRLEEARTALGHGQELLSRSNTGAEINLYSGWRDWAIAELLQTEAAKMIEDPLSEPRFSVEPNMRF